MKHFNLIIFLILFGIIICTISCSKWDLDRISFTEVITVGASQVSATSAFLIGDIQGLREGNITETGFVYSSTAKTADNLQLEKEGVFSKIASIDDPSKASRAFVTQVTGLEPSKSYFFRAFIRLEQEPNPVYGQIDTFLTLDLTLNILSIQRQSAGCPTKAMVTLEIDEDQPEDIDVGVLWSDSENNVSPSLDDAFVLSGSASSSSGRVQIELDLECDKVYFLRGYMLPQGSLPVLTEVRGFSATSGGKWFQRADFPEYTPELDNFRSFSLFVDNKAYIGIGGCQPTNKVWEYNAASDDWSPIIVEGIERRSGITFTIGNTGYVGGGSEPPDRCLPNLCAQCTFGVCACECLKGDLWSVKDGIWQKTRFAFPKLKPQIGFTIRGKGYFGLGAIEDGCHSIGKETTAQFWSFDPTSGVSSMDPSPVTRGNGFSVGNKGYVSSIVGSDWINYEFDPAASSGNQWKEIQLGLTFFSRPMILGSKTFFIDGFLKEYKMMEFDPENSNSWKQVATLNAGGTQTDDLLTFSINNLGYVYLNREADNFWMYVPEL